MLAKKLRAELYTNRNQRFANNHGLRTVRFPHFHASFIHGKYGVYLQHGVVLRTWRHCMVFVTVSVSDPTAEQCTRFTTFSATLYASNMAAFTTEYRMMSLSPH